MNEQNSTNNIETSTNEIEDYTSEETVPQELTLKEKVFSACDNMHKENKKITRRSVRAGTGGSDRDVQRYINEWYRERAITIPSEGEIVVQAPNSMAQNKVPSDKKVVQLDNSSYNDQPKEEASNLARRISERAAGAIIAEEIGFQYLLDNPDKLPEDLREIVEQAKNSTVQKMANRSEQYNPDFFVEMVMAQFQ